jgi:hypothetical protein
MKTNSNTKCKSQMEKPKMIAKRRSQKVKAHLTAMTIM